MKTELFHRPWIIRVLFLVTAVSASVGIALAAQQSAKGRVLRAEDQETGRIYAEAPVQTGDTVEFDWIHSFEHIPWKEYYTIKEDGTFYLETISVAGFGAGIPAEMDVDYRYEDGLIYMDLKDEKSMVKCVIYPRVYRKLDFKIEEGMHVLVKGTVEIYDRAKNSTYQFKVNRIERDGLGNLYIQYKKLYAKLEKMGYMLPLQ